MEPRVPETLSWKWCRALLSFRLHSCSQTFGGSQGVCVWFEAGTFSLNSNENNGILRKPL